MMMDRTLENPMMLAAINEDFSIEEYDTFTPQDLRCDLPSENGAYAFGSLIISGLAYHRSGQNAAASLYAFPSVKNFPLAIAIETHIYRLRPRVYVVLVSTFDEISRGLLESQ